MPSLKMLGMHASPTRLSLGYHPVFRPSKQGFGLKIKILKYIDPSLAF